MSTKLGSLIAMIGAGMGGYAKGTQQRLENERQQKADGRAEDEYNYQQGERAKTQKLEGDIGAAMASRDVETVITPDMSNADVSLAGPQPTQYKVGDQSYADEGAARAALLGTNSQAARYQRAAQAAAASASIAGLEQSMKFEALAKKAKAEGADQVLTHIQRAQPTLADLKNAGGTMAGAISPEAADVFNTTGSEWKLTPDSQVVHYVDKDAAGREFVNSRVLDKDGTPILNDVHHADLFLQDFKTRQKAQENDTKTFQAAQQITQTGERDKEVAKNNSAVLAQREKDGVRTAQSSKYSADVSARTAAARLAYDKAKDAGSEDSAMDPLTIRTTAQQYLAGDSGALGNIGRGTQGAKNLAAVRNEIARQANAQGLNGADIAAKVAEFQGVKAGSRTLGTRTANIEVAAAEAAELAPLALEASSKVSRSGLLPFGKAGIMFDAQTNNPEMRQFAMANNALVNAFGQVMSRGGAATVADKEHARELLSTAFDQPSYAKAVEQLQAEIRAAQHAPGKVRGAMSNAVSGRSGGHDAPASAAGKVVDFGSLK